MGRYQSDRRVAIPDTCLKAQISSLIGCRFCDQDEIPAKGPLEFGQWLTRFLSSLSAAVPAGVESAVVIPSVFLRASRQLFLAGRHSGQYQGFRDAWDRDLFAMPSVEHRLPYLIYGIFLESVDVGVIGGQTLNLDELAAVACHLPRLLRLGKIRARRPLVFRVPGITSVAESPYLRLAPAGGGEKLILGRDGDEPDGQVAPPKRFVVHCRGRLFTG